MEDKGNIGVYSYRKHIQHFGDTICSSPLSFISSGCLQLQDDPGTSNRREELPAATPPGASEGLCKQKQGHRASPEPVPGIWLLRCKLSFRKKYWFSLLITLLVKALDQV